jgi:hypothetical protein
MKPRYGTARATRGINQAIVNDPFAQYGKERVRI